MAALAFFAGGGDSLSESESEELLLELLLELLPLSALARFLAALVF